MPFEGTFNQRHWGQLFTDNLAFMNYSFETRQNRAVLNDNLQFIGDELDYLRSRVDGGFDPNGGFVPTNTGTKDQIFEVTSSTETARYLNTETYTPDANLLVDVNAGRAVVLQREKPTAGTWVLPTWFTGRAHHATSFWSAVSFYHAGDTYATDLDNPNRFWAAAVEDVRSEWAVENPSQDPREYYVDPTASGGGDGSRATPFNSISDALAELDCFTVRLRTIWGWDSADTFSTDRSVVFDVYREDGDPEYCIMGGVYAPSALTVTDVTATYPNVWTVEHFSSPVALYGLFAWDDLDEDGFPRMPILVDSPEEVSETPGSWHFADNGGTNSGIIYFHWADGTPSFGTKAAGATHNVNRAATNRNLIPTDTADIKVAYRNIHFTPTAFANCLNVAVSDRPTIWMLDCRASHCLYDGGGEGFMFWGCNVYAHSLHSRYSGSDGHYINDAAVLFINRRCDGVGETKYGTGHQVISSHSESQIVEVNLEGFLGRQKDGDGGAYGAFAVLNNSADLIVLGADVYGTVDSLDTIEARPDWDGQALFAGIKRLPTADGQVQIRMGSPDGRVDIDLSSTAATGSIYGGYESNAHINDV